MKSLISKTISLSCILYSLFQLSLTSFLTEASRHFNHITLVEMNGLEPTTPCLQSRCSTN